MIDDHFWLQLTNWFEWTVILEEEKEKNGNYEYWAGLACWSYYQFKFYKFAVENDSMFATAKIVPFYYGQ